MDTSKFTPILHRAVNSTKNKKKKERKKQQTHKSEISAGETLCNT